MFFWRWVRKKSSNRKRKGIYERIWIHVVLKIIINLLSDSLAFVESTNDEHRKALSISKKQSNTKAYMYRIVDWGDQRNAIVIMNEWMNKLVLLNIFWIWWVCFYLWRKLNEKFFFSMSQIDFSEENEYFVNVAKITENTQKTRN